MLLLVPNGLFGRQLGADQPSCGCTCLGCLTVDHRETGVTLGFGPTTTAVQRVSIVLWLGGVDGRSIGWCLLGVGDVLAGDHHGGASRDGVVGG